VDSPGNLTGQGTVLFYTVSPEIFLVESARA
jgi:hypothetical protein